MGKVVGLGIALVNTLCPVCLTKDDMIVMNQRLSEKNAKEIEEAHNKTIGYSKEPCDKCKSYMEQGIVVIGVDIDKSTDESIFRSGHFSVVKEEMIKEMIEIPKDSRVISMCHLTGLKLGIFYNKEDIDEETLRPKKNDKDNKE